ncbi:MAG: uncharacterized protein JWN61_2610 [Pseudonocardiales bacterium]|nr:uncharacterized protein [Pseudonocardiales bacterium]
MPLILGFFVLAFLMVAGSIAASDAYLDQRALQSSCDGAVLAGVNAIDEQLAFTRGVGLYESIPLGPAREAAQAYLDRDASRSAVRIQQSAVTGGSTLSLLCVETSLLAFGSVFGYGDGVQHRATASARADFLD